MIIEVDNIDLIYLYNPDIYNYIPYKKTEYTLKYFPVVPISEKVDGYEGGLQVTLSDRFPAAETYFNQKNHLLKANYDFRILYWFPTNQNKTFRRCY
jgi:hypothetical protein